MMIIEWWDYLKRAAGLWGGGAVTVDSQLLREKKNGANQEEFVFMSVCVLACLSLCDCALQRISVNSGSGRCEE